MALNSQRRKATRLARLLVTLILLLGSGTAAATPVPATAAPGQVSVDPETEARQAAAGFLYPLAMALTVLRLECRQWMAHTDNDVDVVARNWWLRNRDDLDAASWITRRAVEHLRSTEPPDQVKAAEQQLMQTLGAGEVNVLQGLFKRQIPTAASCAQALQGYKVAQLDVANLAQTQGYERFGEFGAALKRARADPAFEPPDDAHRTFEAQLATSTVPIATLDAAEAAKARGDTEAVVAAFRSLVDRGDAQAAEHLGAMYLKGQMVARDYPRAAAWFYNAWAMGNPGGMDSLGIMARDGLGEPVDRVLAIAAFAQARAASLYSGAALAAHASQDFSELAKQASPAEMHAAACLTSRELDSRLRKSAASDAVPLREAPSRPDRTLAAAGALAPQFDVSTTCSDSQ